MQRWVQVLGLLGRVVRWLAAVCSCIIRTPGSDLGPLCGRLKVVLVLVLVLVGDQVGLDFVSWKRVGPKSFQGRTLRTR